MGKNGLSEISSPLLTGGSGNNFENKVQSLFLLQMLTDGKAVCMDDCSIRKIIFQARRNGIYTDDLVVIGENNEGKTTSLLIQIKETFSVARNSTFDSVINSAWHDFKNTKLFCFGRDKIVVATGPLSIIDINVSRQIFEIARCSNTYDEFDNKLKISNLFSKAHREKYDILKEYIKKANGNVDPDNQALFNFIRSFYLIGFDLDIRESVCKSLINSICNISFRLSYNEAWLSISEFCRNLNENAGEITYDSDNVEYNKLKSKLKNIISIEEEFNENVSIPDIKNINALIKFALVGSWNEINAIDKNKIEDLFHQEYGKVKNELYSIQSVDKSLISKDGSIWICNKNDEIKKLLLDFLSEDELKEIEPIFISTLSEINPQFNLPKDKRYLSIFSHTEKLSSKILKENLISTLIFLWYYRKSFTNINASKIQFFISEIFNEVLRGKDWKVWASLNDYISDFAEIAPETYLRLLQIQLTEHRSEICALFENEGDGIFSGTLLSGLLWGLEKLSFYEKYFPSSVNLLALLHQYDIGGKFLNRPFNSLHELFLPWIKQTQAKDEVRINVLKRLISDYVELGNKLLIDILQRQNTISNPISLPTYDGAVTSFNRNVAKDNFKKLVEQYSDILIEQITKDAIPLSDIINNLDSFYSITLSKLLDFFEKNDIFARLNEEQKYETWYSLSLIIRKHKYFKKSEWAFPNDILLKLENFSNLCIPTDVLKKSKILFSEWSHNLYDKEYGEDFRKEEKVVLDKRISALREIIAKYGIKIIYSYIDSDLMARNIAITMSSMLSELDINTLFPDIFNTEDENIKSFYYYFLRFANNEQLLQALDREKWNDKNILELFTHLNFEKQNWELAEEELSCPLDYWKLINHLPLQSETDLTDAIIKIMAVKRYDYALLCFFAQLYNKKEINDELLLDALIKNDKLIDVYDLHELIKYCQKQELNHEKMILIEWKYLSFIHDDSDIRPLNLYNELQTNPDFFIEVLSLAFKEEGDKAEKVLSETEKNNSINAYNLLHKWKTLPGLKDNILEEEYLKKWVTEVQEKAENVNRLSIANLIIGHVLFYSPSDNSGFWINKTVAEILNKIENLRMREGFHSEAINSRGVYSVDYTGKAELEIANSWKLRAESLNECGFYELSTTVMDLYNMYINESERAKSMKKPESITYIVKKGGEE